MKNVLLFLQRININSNDWLVQGPWEAKCATMAFKWDTLMGALSSDIP